MIRVLVVDDSAFARKVVRTVLEAAPDMEVVGTARDGLEALTKIAELKPDVVTLDLVMPNLDGLEVMRALPGQGAPRVVLVCMADATSDMALAALDAGAVDLVQKPTPQASERLYELGAELLFKVRAAAKAAVPAPEQLAPAPAPAATPTRPHHGGSELLLIGASTGGPQAVSRVLKALPADFPAAVAVVLHLPAGFTQSFSQRLDAECALRVTEAEEGARLSPGSVQVAPGGFHLKLRRDAQGFYAHLSGEPSSLHRPSVDQLFASGAEVAPGKVLAVVLTGMGDDGVAGGRALRDSGSRILVEAESTCVVYGMPRAVKEAQLAFGQHRLGDMAGAILAAI
jgi:two-component system, chemotaxis family, protein-glutamate methylesterase/glutaminase